ncbi:MAG: S8 family serine peptidase [Phycisphaerae bacterium]|nr:S8 family serine peptidase [Phycisphaerae bacterium]
MERQTNKERCNIGLIISAAAVQLIFPFGAIANEKHRIYSPAVVEAREAARQMGVPENQLPRRTVAENRLHKQSLPRWQRKLNSMVLDRYERLMEDEIVQQPHLAPKYATPHVRIDDRARLLVEMRVDSVDSFDAPYLASLGGRLHSRAKGYGLLVAWIPVDKLQAIAERNDVRRIFDAAPLTSDLGSATTEGDALHGADQVRTMFGYDGTGQTVGVISDGVNDLADAISTGDLVTVDVLSDYTDASRRYNEGTAMLEIIADMAPGANLMFHSGLFEPDFINAVRALVDAGATIIVDDLTSSAHRLFEPGPVTQAKIDAVEQGVFYTASAGNRAQRHYEEEFNGPSVNVTLGPNTYNRPHRFAPFNWQLRMKAPPSGAVTICLQWAEPYGSASINLDLYLLGESGNLLDSSTDPQDGDDDPIECIDTTVSPNSFVNVVVDATTGDPDVFFDLRGAGTTDWQYLVSAGSINGASRAEEIYAVGAHGNGLMPGSADSIDASSSRGPVKQIIPFELTWMKPDIAAASFVQISGAGGFGYTGCPGLPSSTSCFPGTSAAAPHVAGCAALLLQARPWLSPAQVAQVLDDTADDIEAGGPDNTAGHGRMDCLAAVRRLRNTGTNFANNAFDSGTLGSDTAAGPAAEVAWVGPIWASRDANTPGCPCDISCPCVAVEYNNYFKFDLLRVYNEIISAKLVLEYPVGAHVVPTEYETDSQLFVLHEVTSDPDSFGYDFLAGTIRPFSESVYNDLADGPTFGFQQISAADEGSLIEIELNVAAITAMNTARGNVFTIGGRNVGPGGLGTIASNDVPPHLIFANTGLPGATDPSFGFPTIRRLKYAMCDASSPGNTACGTNVEAAAGGHTVTFESVIVAGETTITESSVGEDPPAGFRQACDPPQYFDVSTTATVAGNISVCLTYDDVACPDEEFITLWHFVDGAWENVTDPAPPDNPDTTANIICGTVTELSPFLLAVDIACASGNCNPIPAVSHWGIVILALLVCALGTAIYGPRTRWRRHG